MTLGNAILWVFTGVLISKVLRLVRLAVRSWKYQGRKMKDSDNSMAELLADRDSLVIEVLNLKVSEQSFIDDVESRLEWIKRLETALKTISGPCQGSSRKRRVACDCDQCVAREALGENCEEESDV